MSASITHKGSFKNLDRFLARMKDDHIYGVLDALGAEGVSALASATPVDTGMAASSWSYDVNKKRGSYSLTWSNHDTAAGTPVVILLQYGHGTGTGGYVQGRDFINPAIRPIFDRIAEDVWKAVTTA